MTKYLFITAILICYIFSIVVFAKIDNKYTIKENLGPNINTQFTEIGPIISPDGKTLFFCRGGDPSNIGGRGQQDIWFSTLDSNGQWLPAKNIGEPLNNEGPNHVHSVTPDGNILVLGGLCNFNSIYTGEPCISFRTSFGWSNPVKMNIVNFYNLIDFFECYLSNDGKTLIMSFQRKDSYGEGDLYVSFLIDENTWSEPMNLGNKINTIENELSPFLASDGITLYFSSSGHGGFGDNDIFVSRRLDDTWTNWSIPENLGPSINTSGYDGYYKIPASGEYAYLASFEQSNNSTDIFRILLPEKAKPKPVILVYGKVTNSKTNKPVEAFVKYETLSDGKEVGIARTNPANGEYKITLPSGYKYGIRAEAKGFVSINDNINALNIKKYNEIEMNLKLTPILKGELIRLNNIFFDFAKSDLRPESFPELDRIVKFLIDNPNIKIEVHGHTDNIGSDKENIILSKDRAKAVVQYLIDKKINKNRMKYIGFGKSKFISKNDSEQGRQMNRRVEFLIKDE